MHVIVSLGDFYPLGKQAELTAQYLILNLRAVTYTLIEHACKSRHTVVCRAAQEAGA